MNNKDFFLYVYPNIWFRSSKNADTLLFKRMHILKTHPVRYKGVRLIFSAKKNTW